jgi:hypothetical protein
MDIPTAISKAYVPRTLSVDILAVLPENVRHLLAISISHSSPSLSAWADRQLLHTERCLENKQSYRRNKIYL